MTLTDFCMEIKNWFETEKRFGEFIISDGTLAISSLQDGQDFRIIGSIFNDGVYQYPATNLHDETFDGAVWEMAVPKDVLDLITQINEWETQNASVLNSPYQSESFGGYSYSKESGGSSGGAITWQSHFANQLNKWRKIR